MSDPVQLTDNWALGMRTDRIGENMPPNSASKLVNIIPGQGLAPAMLRNGWGNAYTSAANFTGFSASSTSISALAWAPFSSGNQCLIMVDQSGRILRLTVAGTGSLLDGTGTGAAVTHQPFFHKDIFYICNSAGTGYPYTVNSAGTVAAMSGDVPKARTGASWGSYLILANGGNPADSYTIYPRRVWFSDVGAVTFTMANNSYEDFPEEVIKVVPTNNGLVVFGYRQSWTLTGTTPAPNRDLVRDDLFPVGAVDPNTIKKWNEYIIYANPEAIHKTDGISNVDLTKRCEVMRDYRNDMADYTTGYTAAGGVYGDFYFLTVCNASAVEQFTWVIDLNREVAFKFKGFPTKMYAEVTNGPQASNINAPIDCLFGLNTPAQVGRIQNAMVDGPSDYSGVDANGVVIDWEILTALYRLGTNATKRFRRLWVSYDWDNTGAGAIKSEYTVLNNPVSTLSTSMTTVTTFPTGRGRQPIFINDRGRWIAFRFSNTTPGTSAIKNFALFGLDLEYHDIEHSRSATA